MQGRSTSPIRNTSLFLGLDAWMIWNQKQGWSTWGEPMRGLELIMWSKGQWEALKKTESNGADRQTNRQTDRHLDIATLWLNRPSGADSVKIWLTLKISRLRRATSNMGTFHNKLGICCLWKIAKFHFRYCKVSWFYGWSFQYYFNKVG